MGPKALRVLVVDDAVFMRSMLKDIFAHEGHTVVGEASNGAEAVQKFEELRPDLVTMDIVMPFKNGIEATREILAIDRLAVILMCSALEQQAMVMEALAAGAKDFVLKPFKPDDVRRVVGKVFGGLASAAPRGR